MKKFVKCLLIIAALAAITLPLSSCFRQDMVMYEDGEFDGADFSDYDLMLNAEIEMDDINRD